MEKIIEILDISSLILLATFITTITAFSKKIRSWLFAPTRDEIKKNRVEILKLTITNSEINPQERIRAYNYYKRIGGNGAVDEYVETKLKPILHKEYEK
jgi:hypothetical protein